MTRPAGAGGPAAAVTEPGRRRGRIRLRYRGTVLLLMSPWIIGFVAFYVYPTLASLYYSFTKYSLVGQPQWVGLLNYRFMFTSDPQFWESLRNTIWITLWGTATSVAFAIASAVVLT